MQFDRAADGRMTPLPRPSVDTGMGLERIAAVMQGVHSNYDIDLFRRLIAAAAEVTGTADTSASSLRVIADHIRAAAFLVTDGVLPGNEGRGYVLRRIIRRALRHGHELGVGGPFFHRLVTPLVAVMGEAYPELASAAGHVERVLKTEEERFAETLAQGMGLLGTALDALDGGQLPGEVVFRLYDTYGFPVDLTADVARARGIDIDRDGFEAAMDAQRERARAAQKFNALPEDAAALDVATTFTGHDTPRGQGRVCALLREGLPVGRLNAGEAGIVVLDRTPFYAESGGQVGDQGVLHGAQARFTVDDTRKSGEGHLHVGRLESGTLAIGDMLTAEVDVARRAATACNHTATHLLHAALREVLGSHVAQKGSLVTPERLRFDFSHYEALSSEQLAAVEALVNAQIRANAEARTQIMGHDEAVAAGAMALFGEKYGDRVRVLSIGDFSTELCGGTHVGRAGDIGLFKITAETGIAAGVRRIEAVAGEAALARVATAERTLDTLAALVRAGRGEVEDKVRGVLERNKALEREAQQLRARLAAGGAGRDPLEDVQEVAGLRVLALRLPDDTDQKTLRDTVDRLRDKIGSGVVVVGAATAAGKVFLAAGVTPDQVRRVAAGRLVAALAAGVGGKGGGRPDFAQAGGNDPTALDATLAGVAGWVGAHAAPAA